MPRMCILSVSEQEVFDKPPVFDHREERPGIRGIGAPAPEPALDCPQGRGVPVARAQHAAYMGCGQVGPCSWIRASTQSRIAGYASAAACAARYPVHPPRPAQDPVPPAVPTAPPHRDGRGPAPASTRTRRCRRHRRRADPPARRPCRSCRGSAGGVCGDRGDRGANLGGDFMAPNPS